MDKAKAVANRWAWLPTMMPGVQRLLAEHRLKLGHAHVQECWRRGVLLGEPGWFYAREGALAVGTPWGEYLPPVTRTEALLVLAEPHKSGVQHGQG